ncbi:MAG: AMP-binding protein [Sphingopyxis sp.]|nr:AMP-binding protein [Sphingopyxis sp.]
MNIVSIIDASARREPTKSFAECGGSIWTYADAVAASHREARRLSEAGIGKGDSVAIFSRNRPEFLVAMMAVWRVGAILVPMNHKLAPPECAYILEHSGVKLVYADPDLVATLNEVEGAGTFAVTRLDTIGQSPDDDSVLRFDSVDVPDAAPAEILYTSGTTGNPKGCVHSHGTMRTTATQSALTFAMTANERMLIAMPIWHAAPLNNFAMSTLLVGGTIVMLPEYEPEAFIASLQEDRITAYFGAPVSFSLPLGRPGGLAGSDFSSVRALFYGGGPIGAELSQRLATEYQTDRFFQVYGMTETGPSGTVLYPHEQQAKAGSIGRCAQPGVDMRVVDEAGRDVEADGVGEIWLRSAGLMTGYLGNDEATRAVVDAGWYKTGDLARVDADGYLFIVDRLKDMIITGGENVYSKEVEDALMAAGGITDCAVIGLPHPEWGETVVAVVVPTPGTAPTAAALQVALQGRLAPYKMPRRVLTADTLPRTPTGKVMKHALRAMFAAEPAHSNA